MRLFFLNYAPVDIDHDGGARPAQVVRFARSCNNGNINVQNWKFVSKMMATMIAPSRSDIIFHNINPLEAGELVLVIGEASSMSLAETIARQRALYII
ncbi:hypothetical protein E3N88_19451 [Mikania micrantha]|uniref:Uncharacterized protein n=1 Tax=Mikania micrantha TaxID=192012 RepID=A0A5N6NQM1_9ASTR|nr:hypothetical protein E3N88_19451 [Mikania micrantha]